MQKLYIIPTEVQFACEEEKKNGEAISPNRVKPDKLATSKHFFLH